MTSASSLSSTSSSSGVSLTDIFHAFNNTDHDDNDGNNQWQDQVSGQKDLYTQVVIASALGLAAFMGFCFLRPRWRSLYAARKRTKGAANILPDLPDTFFGWIPVLYRITEEEVLASAGLDAFVFLRFFKFAQKYLAVAFFFGVAVILPVHYKYTGRYGFPFDGHSGNDTAPGAPDDDGVGDFGYGNGIADYDARYGYGSFASATTLRADAKIPKHFKPDNAYLWIYVVFTYLFTALAVYLLIYETDKIIKIRQRYLGGQSTVTDRTIRLSGIPPELRSEEKIRDFIEDLEIGKVDSVMICKNWRALDGLMEKRAVLLRRLEEAWVVHLGFKRHHKRDQAREEVLPIVQPPPEEADGIHDDENVRLLSTDDSQAHVSNVQADRPTTRIWFGWFNLQSRKIDAINYYEERLRQIDEKIEQARKMEYQPTPLAFVTMESTAACQMAVQAILDPHPMRLLATLAPAPADVIWSNTYLPRTSRMMRSWSITFLIGILTIFWSVLLVPLAWILNIDTIEKLLPGFAQTLEDHPLASSLVRTGLPTALLSLLTVLVPFVYAWLANLQGMTSHGDIELSLVSKNYFFTFFNLFLVFTVFATASNFYGFWDNLRDVLKDTTSVAYALARSLEKLAPFYYNLIVLQGLGLFPFRLLEFGAVAMYPIMLLGARTPRDYADLKNPPTFSYGFYLPQTILIFVICIVYSILPGSWLVCLFGLIYFVMGSFIYKYQLLYAMDHRQHSTGRAWPMICSRVIIGLIFFQISMAGILALRTAITRSILVLPLIAATMWFHYWFGITFEPLTKFIALRSIDRDGEGSDILTPPESRWDADTNHGRAVDLSVETGTRYINPNLVTPLDGVWIGKRRVVREGAGR